MHTPWSLDRRDFVVVGHHRFQHIPKCRPICGEFFQERARLLNARMHGIVYISVGEHVQAGVEDLHAGLATVVVNGKGLLGVGNQQLTGIV